MRNLPPLNSIRAFEAASRQLSFQAAADELSITPSALSHQIKLLEDHLQTKLFHRGHRKVELTSAGELICSKVGEGFDKLSEAFGLLQPNPDEKTLIITTGPAFSAKWLAPRLHYYLEQNPEVDLRLSANLNLVDFIADGIDLGIRFGAGNYPDLYVERLFREVYLPLISPQFLRSLNLNDPKDMFDSVSILHDDSAVFLSDNIGWKQWFTSAKIKTEFANRGSRFSHADHALEAAVDGAGIVLGRLALAWRDIASGRLVAPFDIAIPVEASFYFVCPESHLQSPKVLNFLGWMRDEAYEQQQAMNEFLSNQRIKKMAE